MLLLCSVKLDQSRFDKVGLAFSVTVVLFVKAFRFLQRDQPCEHPPLFVRGARIGKLSLDDDQVRIVDELFHRSHERLPVPARRHSVRMWSRSPATVPQLGGSYGTVAGGRAPIGARP